MGLRVGGAPAYAHIRRAFERGEPLTPWHIGVLTQANAAALDVLYRIGGDSPATVWLPGVEEGEARRMVGRALLDHDADPGHGPEGPERRNLSEAEFNEEGVAFAPFVTEEQKRAFFDALTREAEKRVLVMPTGADLDQYASEAAPSGNVEGANK